MSEDRENKSHFQTIDLAKYGIEKTKTMNFNYERSNIPEVQLCSTEPWTSTDLDQALGDLVAVMERFNGQPNEAITMELTAQFVVPYLHSLGMARASQWIEGVLQLSGVFDYTLQQASANHARERLLRELDKAVEVPSNGKGN